MDDKRSSRASPFAYQTRILERTSSVQRKSSSSSILSSSSNLQSPKPTFLDGISQKRSPSLWSKHKGSQSVGDVASKWEARSQLESQSRSPSPSKFNNNNLFDSPSRAYSRSPSPTKFTSLSESPTKSRYDRSPSPIKSNSVFESPSKTNKLSEVSTTPFPTTESSTKSIEKLQPSSKYKPTETSVRAFPSTASPTKSIERSTSPSKSGTNQLPSSVFTPFSHSNLPPSPTPNRTPSLRRNRPLSLQSTPDLAKSSVGALKALGQSQPLYRTNSLSRHRSVDFDSYNKNNLDKDNQLNNSIGKGLPQSSQFKNRSNLGRITSGDAENDWDENLKPGGWEDDNRIRFDNDSLHFPGLTDTNDEVAGLPGRVRLSRSNSLTQGSQSNTNLRRSNALKSSNSPIKSNSSNTSSILSRTQFMTLDKQRHLLAAYEYLCHISEAIRWMEDCLDNSLDMDEVQAEEGLRDGLILFKLASVWGFGEGMEDGHYGWDYIKKNHTGNRKLFRVSHLNIIYSFILFLTFK